MFQTEISPLQYADPWLINYGERLNELKTGHCKVAYYYYRPDTSSFRYRVYNMVQALKNNKKEISASYFYESDLDNYGEIIDVADILIICRGQYCDRLDNLITAAKNKGKTVIYDIDDMVFDIAHVRTILNTIDTDITHPEVWNYWFGEISRYGAVMSMCDRVITTNNYLADRVKKFSHLEVSVIPNFLNEEQLEISRKIYDEKKKNNFKSTGPVCLGYFSGTRTHNKDFRIVSNALAELFGKHPDMVLRIVGYVDLDDNFTRFQDRIEFIDFKDFINLQVDIGQVEINLIPLQDNVFTNSKSELKYFEAGIVGTVSIASPTHVYTEAINDGVNGFLAYFHEWRDKIEEVLTMTGRYREVAENAFSDSEKKYVWYNNIDLIEKVLLQ